jgi:hypothetical protein
MKKCCLHLVTFCNEEYADMHFVGIVMEMLLLLLKNIQDVSPTGKYLVLSVDNCKKEGCFSVCHYQLTVPRQNMDDDHTTKTVQCSPLSTKADGIHFEFLLQQ